MPAKDRSNQFTFLADEDVKEYLDECDNKTRALNAGIRMLMEQEAQKVDLEERVARLEQRLKKVEKKIDD